MRCAWCVIRCALTQDARRPPDGRGGARRSPRSSARSASPASPSESEAGAETRRESGAGKTYNMALEKIAGDFEFDRDKLLGRGAWGDVYTGKQISLNRPVAIKFLKKELTADPDFVRRFRREAECLAKLTAEHIIQVYSAGEHEGSHFFIMEYVQGTPLSRLIEKKRLFSAEEITYVAVSVGKALKAAWSSPAQIVHRDIKPANIMVSYSSSIISPSPQQAEKTASMMMVNINLKETQIKVMDFGLAKLAHGGDQEATMAGTVIGTPKYISPEQGMGNPADIRSDIYSMGIVLYEMATGKIPFSGESAMSIIRHHIYDTAIMISHAVPDFPPTLEAIIMKCIQKDPNSRYDNPNKLLEDLDFFEKGKPPIHAAVDPSRISAVSAEHTMLAPSSVVRLQVRKKKKALLLGAIASPVVIIAALALWQPWKATEPTNLSGKTTQDGIVSGSADTAIGEKSSPTNPQQSSDTLMSELKEKYSTAEALVKEDKLDEGKVLLEEILGKKPDYTPAFLLLQDVKKKIDEREVLKEKIRLAEATKSESFILIESPKTPPQHRYNRAVQDIESKNYTSSRAEVQKLIEMEDEIIHPAAIYLQIRIWNLSLETNYLDEMRKLYTNLTRLYPQSDFVALSKTFLDNAIVSAEQMAVDNIISEVDKENEPYNKGKILENFISKNESNRFIDKAKEKLSEIKEEIRLFRLNNYRNAISNVRKGLVAQSFKEARDWAIKAEEYTDDPSEVSEINRLKEQIEKSFLDYHKIEPLTDQREPNSHALLKIKNITDDSEMILIQGGEFIRGNDSGNPNERPARKINLSSYYVDKFEITNRQFKKFVEATVYITEAEQLGFGLVYTDGMLKEVKGVSWRNPRGGGEVITKVQVRWTHCK
ncbi:MAG: protein kinase [Planctomycetota bacterium]|nr:protein kinase [Planctomycetota bacterium]